MRCPAWNLRTTRLMSSTTTTRCGQCRTVATQEKWSTDMAFRAKYRLQAMQKRVEQGRVIKSDLDEFGAKKPAYKALQRSWASRKAAATRRAQKAHAQDPKVIEKALVTKGPE